MKIEPGAIVLHKITGESGIVKQVDSDTVSVRGLKVRHSLTVENFWNEYEITA